MTPIDQNARDLAAIKAFEIRMESQSQTNFMKLSAQLTEATKKVNDSIKKVNDSIKKVDDARDSIASSSRVSRESTPPAYEGLLNFLRCICRFLGLMR